MKTRILIVENDAVTALDLEGLLIEAGHFLTGIASANEALKIAKRSPPDLVLLDIGIAGSVDGIELARRLQECFSLAHVYVTGHIEPAILLRANHTGIEIALCRNGQRCRAASNLGAPAPFVVDRSFPVSRPVRIAGDVCPMELRCSLHLVTAGWSGGDSLAAPGTTVRSSADAPKSDAAAVAASWRPE